MLKWSIIVLLPGNKFTTSKPSPKALTTGYSSRVPSYINWLPIAVIVSVSDYTRSFASNNLTISPNGSDKIGGVAEDLILNIPPSITIDEEPVFYANISGNNSSFESNQILNIPIYSGSVALRAQGNFVPGSTNSLNILSLFIIFSLHHMLQHGLL